MKRCSHCSLEKPLSEFHTVKTGKKAGKVQSWCKDCTNRRGESAWYRRNKNRVLVQKRRHAYGLDQGAFDAIVEAQGGVCAICHRVPEVLCVDHDHLTGRVRGLLCKKCNLLLGHAEDTLERLLSAAIYLEKWL